MHQFLLNSLWYVGCSDKEAEDTAPPHEEVRTDHPICNALELSTRPYDPTAPEHFRRHQPAGDFSVPLRDGTTWTLSEQWTGCESYLFLPHWFSISPEKSDTYWSTGVFELLVESDLNVHYFFVPAQASQEDTDALGAQMEGWIEEAMAGLTENQAKWWRERLHVVASSSSDIPGLVGDGFASSVGTYGFGIDREQKIRSLGYFPHVSGYSSSLASAGEWPYENRLFSAAYEAIYFNFEAERQIRLDAVDATVVPVFGGDVIEQFEDGTLALPDAQTMSTFDTMEIDIRMECPDKDKAEIGNCGAWDYLAHMWLYDDANESWLEMGRFITTYHRESRWVVDASHALAWLQDGGDRTIRYQWAHEWNTQPTGVTLTVRFSNQNKGVRPTQIIPLFTGGGFSSTYNDRQPVDAVIPSGAQKVELVAITTGHGMDTGNCAEFCKHEHHYTVGSTTHTQAFDEPGIDDQCANSIYDGVVPNQAGTWWFGRGGWCPGQRVDPFVVDVTGDLSLGSSVSVTYTATQNGNEPRDGQGNINHNSWLVVYE